MGNLREMLKERQAAKPAVSEDAVRQLSEHMKQNGFEIQTPMKDGILITRNGWQCRICIQSDNRFELHFSLQSRTGKEHVAIAPSICTIDDLDSVIHSQTECAAIVRKTQESLGIVESVRPGEYRSSRSFSVFRNQGKRPCSEIP